MTMLAILFALALLVWLIPAVRVSRISQLATAVLIAGTVFGPTFFAVDGPIQVSLDRLMWVGLLGIVAIRWRTGQLSFDRLHRIDWILIILAVWLLVGAMRGGSPPTGSSPTARWLFYIVMPLGMYAACRAIHPSRSDVRWFNGAMVGLGSYLALTAVLEVAGLHFLVFPSFITDPEAWEFYGRGRGPLMNPAGNGIVMSISMVLVTLNFLAAGRRGKVMYAALAMLIGCGIYATLTRSVWLGAAGALGMIAMVYAPRWLRVIGLASVVLLSAAMAMGLKDQLVRLERDKHLTAEDAEKSIELRPLLAVIAWEMFKDRPIIGHGFGHYFEHSGPYHSISRYELPLEQAKPYAQHSLPLSILVDAGLVGLVLLMILIAILGSIGWQLARDRQATQESRFTGMLLLSMLVVYLSNGLFHDVLVIPMVHMYLFFISGLAVTLHSRGLAASRPATAPAVKERRSVSVSHA